VFTSPGSPGEGFPSSRPATSTCRSMCSRGRRSSPATATRAPLSRSSAPAPRARWCGSR